MNVNNEAAKSPSEPTEPVKETDPDESEAESNDDDEEGDEKDGEDNQESDSSASGSDSSDSNEKCPICLLSFHDQEIGSPDVCEHAFCVPCIEVWSSSVKTCPIDRKSFTSINVHQSFDVRKLLRSIAVDTNSNKELVLIDEEEEDATLCEICRRSDREDVMLLCDGCNRGYHIDCLTPALPEIPHGSWYCDNCFSSHSSSESDEGEIDDLLNELEDVGGHLVELGRMRHQPRITRTRQSERIRNTILTTTGRRQATASIIRPQPSTSRSITASTSRAASTLKPRVVRKKRRKKYRRRTRTVVVEYDLNSDSKFPIATKKVKITRRRKKRKVKRKTKKTSTRRTTATPSASSSSSKANLEHGLSGRRTSRSILPNFNLMGPKRDMDVLFSDGDGEDEAHDAYTRAIASGSGMMLSIRNSSHSGNLIKNKNSIMATISASSSSAMPNLLDSIMQSQEIWHSKEGMKKVVIGKGKKYSKNFGFPNTE
jgi:PHD and RING finger domain-containing protein 1